MAGWLVSVIVKVQVDEDTDAGDRAVDRALLKRRQYIAERHRHGSRTKPVKCHCLELRGEDPNLLTFEVGDVADRSFRDDARRLGNVEADAM